MGNWSLNGCDYDEYKEIRNNVIDEFVEEMKGNAGGGLITSWDKPCGISYERIEEIAEQMKGDDNND